MSVQPVEWASIVDALIQVEDIPPDESGLISFGAQPGNNGIFVERGRICWVAAQGLQRRLADLLQQHVVLKKLDLDAFYLRCREQGKLLGPTLVADGWISQEAFNLILRKHSAECLVELSRRNQPTYWVPHAKRGYSAHSTFRAVDALFDVAQLVAPQLQEQARAELQLVSGPGRRGAAYVLNDALDSLIPIAELGDSMSLRTLRALGRWSLPIPNATRLLGATPAFALAATAAGETISVWWRGPLLFALACEDRSSVAAVTAHHLACL